MRLFMLAVVAAMGISVAAIVWWALRLHRSSQDLRALGRPEVARSVSQSVWLVTGLAIAGFVLFVDLLISVW